MEKLLEKIHEHVLEIILNELPSELEADKFLAEIDEQLGDVLQEAIKEVKTLH